MFKYVTVLGGTGLAEIRGAGGNNKNDGQNKRERLNWLGGPRMDFLGMDSSCLNLYLGKVWYTWDVGDNTDRTVSEPYPVHVERFMFEGPLSQPGHTVFPERLCIVAMWTYEAICPKHYT